VLDAGNTADENDFIITLRGTEPDNTALWFDNPLEGKASKDVTRATDFPVTIHFGCTPCQVVHSSPVTLTINWGWVGPTTFTYYKDCAPEPSCTDSGKHGGMSGAGVAALVIFLLGFVACVGGCGYNKFAQHKRGLAIIPGATTAATCFDQLSTSGRAAKWTPQESDASVYGQADETGSISGGAGGYQSYSSNL
jgi:hypothetical protein